MADQVVAQTSEVVRTSSSETLAVSNGFKETEIGPIPVDWEVASLSDVATLSRKPRGLDLSAYETIPFIPMNLIPDDGIRIESYIPKQPSEIKSGTYFERGDVLLAKITPSFENGKQGIADDIPTPFGYATTEVYPLQPHPDKLDRMFLFHYLKLPSVRAEIAGKMEGTTGRQRVPKRVIETYPLPLPSLPEQRRIARVLSAIQRAIAAQDDLIAAARQVKRSLMERLFRYGPGAKPAPTKETEIGEVPAHWEVVRLGELVQQGGGSVQTGPFGSLLHASDYVAEGIPVVMPKDLTEQGKILPEDIAQIGVYDYQRLERYHLKTGDLLVARRGEIGRRGLVTEEESGWVCGTGCLRIRPGSLLDSRFLLQVFANARLREWLTVHAIGTTMLNLSARILDDLPLPFLSLSEQQEIAQILAVADRKIEVEEQRKAALQELFQSTLHQLMTGQIRVKEQPPPRPSPNVGGGRVGRAQDRVPHRTQRRSE
jgi:type I restriction enzyme S subunit